MEFDDGHGDGGDQKTKIYLKELFCFATQDTIEGVSGFRTDNRTTRRGNL